MTPLLFVQGTHGWGRGDEPQWWRDGSPLIAFLEARDFVVLGKQQPFIWSTNVDGVQWWHGKARKHINWESAGCSLYAFLRNPLAPSDYVPLASRNLVGHSHAMQVIAYACAAGLKINRLLTLGSPVRADMREIYAAARPNIGHWLHVHSDSTDKMQWYGELFDGHFGIVRKQPFADVNLGIPAVAHSRLLNDPACFPLWQCNGMIDFLRSP